MARWHTVIIGAGPGGLACAEILASKGISVLVLEKKGEVGPKVCAGGVTGAGLCRDLPPGLIERTFRTQHIVTSLQQVVLASDLPMVSTVDRGKLGAHMLDKARAAGATVRPDAPVARIEAGRIIMRSGETIVYRHLVGADGSVSLVRRYLGLPTVRVGVGVQYHIPVSLPHMEWHLDARRFGNGYAWIFPHRQRTSVGAYISHAGLRPKELQDHCREWAAARGIDLGTARPEAARINYDYRGWRFGNIFLIGDAAGLASGLTGEGIFPAILSGKTVANTILNDHYVDADFARLLVNHRRHCRLAACTATNGTLCRLVMESLVLGLRTGLIDFNLLEMADQG